MFDITVVLWLLALGVVFLYWFHALRVKDIAYVAAQRHCTEMQVQLLDQSVYLRRLWFKRDRRGRFFIWRAFCFEFTVTGEDRYSGRVQMLGYYLDSVHMESHRLN